MDPLANKVKRVTEVFLDLQEGQVQKEIMVLPVHLVLLAPLDHLDYQALLVPKEPKDPQDKQDQREKLAHLVPLAPLAHPAMSFILYLSRPL